jgi:hypothetical protein
MNNRIRWYGCIYNALNMKIKERWSSRRLRLRWTQQVRKGVNTQGWTNVGGYLGEGG